MNEEILRSIYGELYNAGLTSSDINTWAQNFVNNKAVRENIHEWLTENEYTSNDYGTWETNVLSGGEQQSAERQEPPSEIPADVLSETINKHATGFWSEERLVPELYKILPSGWSVDEGISNGAEGGSRLSVNNLTLTSPDGISRAFQIGNRETLANDIRDFMSSDEVINAEPVKLETREEQDIRVEQERQQRITDRAVLGGSGIINMGNDMYLDSPEEDTWIEKIPGIGKNHFTNAVGDLIRAGKGGVTQGESLDPSLKYWWEGKDMSDYEISKLVESGRAMEEQGQTDEMLAFNKRYQEIVEEAREEVARDLGSAEEGLLPEFIAQGYIDASVSAVSFMKGWWENPTVMAQYTAQSLSNMAYSAVTNPVKTLTGGAIATGVAVNVPDPTDIITAPLAFTAGAMGTVSATMETGFTTAQLVQELADEKEMDWQSMSNQERMDWYKKVASDEELWGDITSRALKRGLTIGAIDGFTALAVPGASKLAAKPMAVSRLSRFTGAAQVSAAAATETSLGMASEYLGQKAAGQEVNAQEILTEGFADKTFTAVQVSKAAISDPPKYTLNGEVLNGREFDRALRVMDDDAYMNADITVENSPTVEKLVNERINNIKTDVQVDSRVSDVNDRAELIKLEQQRAKLKKAKNETKSGQKKLKDVEAKIDEIMLKYEGSEVDVTIEDRKKAVALAIKDKVNNRYNKNLKFAKEGAEKLGKKFTVVKDTVLDEDGNSSVEMENIINEFNKTAKPEDRINLDEALGADGFFVGDQLVINENVAKQKGQINVGAHELLHGIIAKEVGSLIADGKMKDFISSFRDTLTKEQRSYIEQKINERGDLDINTTEEWLNIFSDGITKGDITFNEGIGSKLMNFIHDILTKYGLNKKFAGGRQAYNFMREYQANIQKGKISQRVADVAGDGVKVDSKKTNFSITPEQKKTAAKNVKALGENQTNKSWRRGGADTAIKDIKDNGYFDALIASKYKVKPVPRDFVEKVYSEITPHIKRFKPEQNDNLFAYINSQIGNKAGNVYNKEYKVDEAMRGSKDIDAKTSEGAPVIQVAAETDTGVKSFEEQDMSMAAQAKRAKLAEQGKSESDKYSGLRTELGLEKPMMDKVRNAVMKTFGTKLPDVNSKKFKAALQKAYRTELKKPIQDMIGKGEVYNAFLAESFPTVFKFLPKETLLQMERNVAPENRIFTKSERITKPTEVDKLISDGLLPKETNRLSGPTLITKLPYPGSRKVMAYFRGQNMENALGYKVGASTLGTRKDKLAMEMGVELGFDATMETLKDPAVLERRQGILELQGFDQKKNEAAIIGKQINRDPSVKFSKSSKETAESSPNKILEKTGSVNPVAYRLEDFISASTGKIKQKRLVDFSRELRDNGVLMELGKHTTDILSSFAKSFPQYLGDLRTTMSGGQGLSFFGLTPVFDKLAVGLKAGPKLADRFTYSGKGKTLNPNKVNKSNGKLKFKQGRETLSKETFVEQQSKKLDILESLFTAIQSHLKDNPSHAWFFARMVSDTVNNQSSIVRVSAPTMAFPVDNKGNLIYDQKIAEEHSFPQNNVGTLLLEAAITGKDIKEVMKIIRGSYMQMALLETHDVQVRQAGYSSKMPDVFWDKVVPRLLDGSLNIKNGLASMVRYAESGIDLNNYLVPGENQTITEYFGVGKFNNASQTLIDKQNELITKFLTGEITKKEATSLINEFAKVEGVIESAVQANTSTYDQAAANRSKFSKSGKAKGMSTFDFDETLIIDGENFIIATDPATGQQLEVKSHEWPLKGPDLAAAGFEFDFSDFAQVRGGKEGPLLQKMRNQISKYGPSNVFVLTARQQESAQPIHEWLNSKGISIPIENITGLGKSEGSAKGQWMLQKFAEGYNDMYFVDDALPNVTAVREVLDELDIKSKVVQAKIKFSKSGPKKMASIIDESALDLNKILEETKGVGKDKRFSAAKARQRGKNKGKFKFFVPPSADDFAGLMYSFMGRGKQGNKHHAWFKKNLFDPFSKGMRRHKMVQQQVANDMKNLRKAMPDVRKKLGKKVPGTEYTHEDAIRIYNWSQAGLDIPGLSQADATALINAIESDPKLQAFAQGVNSISETPGGMVEPGPHWTGGNIALDLKEALDNARGNNLRQWVENKNIIFSEANMNKIEAVYGSNFREALEDSLYRMETGSTQNVGKDRLLNNFTAWIHGSIGTTMFLNARSAMLQMISNVNFVNWSDNNMIKAAGAFANQKQYWKDVSMIFNSPFLKQRRSGIQTDVNAAELLAQIKDSKNKAKAATAYLLQLGFTPTQIADSFAIATGGATFYRNRIKTYLKEGMTQTEAETKAFDDMMEIAEETQQSTRADKISQQQASPIGKFILAFQNTPMKYNRWINKGAQDLVNGRDNVKANLSRIGYKGGSQGLICNGLHTA